MDFIEQNLKSQLYRMDCPGELELGEFEMDFLDSTERGLEIQKHILKCPHCLADLAQIRQFMALPLVDKNLVNPVKASKRSIVEKVRVIVVDLLSQPQGYLLNPNLSPALRGDQDDISTQVFQVESYIIALSAVKHLSSREKQQIIGDISPLVENEEDFHKWSAYLWRDGQLLATTPIGRDSHFIFNNINSAAKPHDLILSGPRVEIHLQNLQMV